MGDNSSSSMMDSNSEIASVSSKIMIATVAVVFILMLLFLCTYIYAKFQMSLSYLEDPNIVSWRRREARRGAARSSGLDASELGSIPIVEFNPKEFKEGLECAVCLSEVSLGEKARILPKCNHGFHVSCIDMWLNSHSTCPICRNPIIPPKNKSRKPNEVQEDESSSSDSEDDYASMESTTNVSFSGNRNQVSSEEGSSASQSTASNRARQELVIDVPRELFEERQEELQEKSPPAVTRLASFKRLLSRGKRVVAPSPRASSSGDVEEQV